MNFDEIRPCWLEINLDNLKHNIHTIKESVKPGSEIMAVIKANAYNHDAVTVARELNTLGVHRFCVSIYIRDSEIKGAIENNLDMTVYDYEQAKLIDECAAELNKKAKIHIKVDTGMSRIGFLPGTVAFERILKILEMKNIICEGIFSHFATADVPNDQGNTRKQYEIFDSFVNSIESASGKKLKRHISNSGAIIDYPEYDLDYVRPGIIMYGYLPDPDIPHKMDLRPLMTLKALISNLKVLPEGSGISYGHSYVTRRITKVATIPLGYADGISRLLSNKLMVTVNDMKAPSIGSICMDQFMVDVTDIDDVKIGDEVVIFGHGKNDTDLTDMAKMMGTIHYEVMCSISRRIPRVYIKDGEISQIINYL